MRLFSQLRCLLQVSQINMHLWLHGLKLARVALNPRVVDCFEDSPDLGCSLVVIFRLYQK